MLSSKMYSIWLLVIFCYSFCLWLMRPKRSLIIHSVWLPKQVASEVFSSWFRNTQHNDLHCEVLGALWRGIKDPKLIGKVVDNIPNSPTNKQLYMFIITAYRLHKLFASTREMGALSLKLQSIIPRGWLWAQSILKCLNPKLEELNLGPELIISTDTEDHSFFIRGQVGFEIETGKMGPKDKWGELILANLDKTFPEYLCYRRSKDQHKYQSLWHYNKPLNELDAFEIIPHLLSMQRKSGLMYTAWLCGTHMSGFYPDPLIVLDKTKLFNLPVPFTNLEDYKVFIRRCEDVENGITDPTKEVYLFSYENGFRVRLQKGYSTVQMVYGKMEPGLTIDTYQSPDYFAFLNHHIYYDDSVPVEKLQGNWKTSDKLTILEIKKARFLINKLNAPIIVKLQS